MLTKELVNTPRGLTKLNWSNSMLFYLHYYEQADWSVGPDCTGLVWVMIPVLDETNVWIANQAPIYQNSTIRLPKKVLDSNSLPTPKYD